MYAIRTGPHEFNKRVVTNERLGGLCPRDRKVAGGRVWDLSGLTEERQREAACMPSVKFLKVAVAMGATVIPTPEERDFFEALSLPYVEPWERA